MKTMNRLFVAAIALLGTMTLQAQPPQGFSPDQGDKQAKRENLTRIKAQKIADELAFDEATTAKFTDTYLACQKEIWALDPVKKHKAEDGSLTDKEAEEIIKAQFERNEKVLQIRKKYYGEYSKFLSQKQILRVNQIEKEMRGKMAEHKGGKGGHGSGAGRGPRPDMQR